MNSFDKWKEEYGLQSEPNYSEHTEKDCKSAFEAGAHSQQAKIDELSRKVESNLEINKNLQNMLDELIDERDELQGWIDEALTYLRHTDFRECKESILFNILKGNKDEN